MKKLLLMIATLAGLNIAQATEIRDWEPSLPITEAALLTTVQQLAYERFFYQGEGVACGGEIADPALSDYYTFMSYSGDLTHNVRLSMYVTGSYNHCEKVTVSKCDLPLTIKSGRLVHIGKWHCTVVGVEGS